MNAGFKENTYDYIVMLNADFMIEFPKNMVNRLIDEMSTNNYDIIQVVRENYYSNFIKARTSNLFYTVFNFISNVKIISTAPDFRIVNYKVFNKLISLKHKIFFRREIHAYDFKIKILNFDQSTQRKSKFTLIKMISFVFESLIFNTGFLKKKNNFVVSDRIR